MVVDAYGISVGLAGQRKLRRGTEREREVRCICTDMTVSVHVGLMSIDRDDLRSSSLMSSGSGTFSIIL